jgi:hypothetical protein
MKTRFIVQLCAGLALLVDRGLAAPETPAPPAPRLAGNWTLDPARSSQIKPWDGERLAISQTGDAVTIHRFLTWGDERKADDMTMLWTDGAVVTRVPVTYWLDTWYNNTYIGGDGDKRVRGEWLDGGRVLKVETSLTLKSQQGDVPVHIYDEYRLSPDGRTLTLFELRSTRDQVLTFVFTRA